MSELQALLKKKKSLENRLNLIKAKKQVALERLECVKQECVAKGVDPDALPVLIQGLKERRDQETSDYARELKTLERAIVSFETSM